MFLIKCNKKSIEILEIYRQVAIKWYNYYSNQIGFYIDPSYLITINNLSEPITKTNEYSMKITYVIKKA